MYHQVASNAVNAVETPTVHELLARLTRLEHTVQGLQIGRKSPEQKAKHAQTAQAMQRHAPALQDDELVDWAHVLKPERIYRAAPFAAEMGIAIKEAKRVLFWLKHHNFVRYDIAQCGYALEGRP